MTTVEVRYHGRRAFAHFRREEDGTPWVQIVTVDAGERLLYASPVAPSNADRIRLAKEARQIGFDVPVPAPQWDKWDYEEAEFRVLLNQAVPDLDEKGNLSTERIEREIFPRWEAYTFCWNQDTDCYDGIRRYAFVRRANGEVVRVDGWFFLGGGGLEAHLSMT